MAHIDPRFVELARRVACLASSLGSELSRGFRAHAFEIPPQWDELQGCLRSVRPEQVAALPTSARAQLIALGQLVERAKLTLERNEFVGDFHELFPDFTTAGLKLWEA